MEYKLERDGDLKRKTNTMQTQYCQFIQFPPPKKEKKQDSEFFLVGTNF